MFCDTSIDQTLYQLSYFFGERSALSIKEEAEKRGASEGMILSALFSGLWCDPDARRRFITDLFIPRYTS